VPDGNAYGMDILVQDAFIPDQTEWRLKIVGGVSASGGGGGFTPTTFLGAGTTGYVPDPISATGTYLRDDGTWVVPTDTNTTDHTLLSNIGTNTHVQLDSHVASTSNPHSVTAAQAGAAPTVHTHTGDQIVGGVVDGGTY